MIKYDSSAVKDKGCRIFGFIRTNSDVVYLKTNIVSTGVDVYFTESRSLILKVDKASGYLYSLEIMGVKSLTLGSIKIPIKGNLEGCPRLSCDNEIPEPDMTFDSVTRTLRIAWNKKCEEHVCFDDSLILGLRADGIITELWLVNLIEKENLSAVREEHLL